MLKWNTQSLVSSLSAGCKETRPWKEAQTEKSRMDEKDVRQCVLLSGKAYCQWLFYLPFIFKFICELLLLGYSRANGWDLTLSTYIVAFVGRFLGRGVRGVREFISGAWLLSAIARCLQGKSPLYTVQSVLCILGSSFYIMVFSKAFLFIICL